MMLNGRTGTEQEAERQACGGQEQWNIDCKKTAKRSQKMLMKQPMWTITTKKLHMTLTRAIQAEWHWA